MFALILASTAYAQTAGSGALWTTNVDCGVESQDINHYAIGGQVHVNGENFASGTYAWDITGNPGGSSGDPSVIVASGNVTIGLDGTFCFYAYTVQPDDWGEYKVTVDSKMDNYRVEGFDSSKTADPHLERTYTWTIDKEVDQPYLQLFVGDQATVGYSIIADREVGQDTHSLTGAVSLTNPEGDFATGPLDVIDCIQYSYNGSWTDLQCTMIGSEIVVGPTATVDVEYDLEYSPVEGADHRNYAYVVLSGEETAGPSTADAAFTPLADPDSEVDAEAVVEDSNGMSWNFSGDSLIRYPSVLDCGDEGSNVNVATLSTQTALPVSDSAEVLVECHSLDVSKDAQTRYTRTYDWDITKAASMVDLLLAEGESYVLDYNVDVTRNHTDSDFAASGMIFVSNPAPMPALLLDVTDLVDGLYPGAVYCGVAFPQVLSPGEVLACSYDTALPDASKRLNTATVLVQNIDRTTKEPVGATEATANAPVEFVSALVTEVDATASVNDSYAGLLGVVGGPASYAYSRTVMYEQCGAYLVENKATVTALDSLAVDSAVADVPVNVTCSEQNGSCTLTQGYWKTHSLEGPAPYDENWQNLGDADLDLSLEEQAEEFRLSLMSYHDVLWTPVRGNVYWDLAHQFIAAELNLLNGASSDDVQDAFDAAQAFFDSYTPEDAKALKKAEKQEAIDLAAVLAAYNEGLIGPGHCDENQG